MNQEKMSKLADGALVFPPSNEGESFVMAWQRVEPPMFWKAFNGCIIADRHLPDGTRQHMVQGHVELGFVLDNAQVIGQEDCPDAVFSVQLSHLSK